jgi:hypothetical protein
MADIKYGAKVSGKIQQKKQRGKIYLPILNNRNLRLYLRFKWHFKKALYER